MRTCTKEVISLTVGSCLRATTPLKAPVAGEYAFVFSWLGVQYRYLESYQAEELLAVRGQWFNERSIVLGHFEDASGGQITNTEGVSQLQIRVRRVVTIPQPSLNPAALVTVKTVGEDE